MVTCGELFKVTYENRRQVTNKVARHLFVKFYEIIKAIFNNFILLFFYLMDKGTMLGKLFVRKI